MKKIIGILGVSVFALTLFMNAAVLTIDSNNEELKVVSFTTTAFANINNCSESTNAMSGKFKRTSTRCYDGGIVCGLAYECVPDSSQSWWNLCQETKCK